MHLLWIWLFHVFHYVTRPWFLHDIKTDLNIQPPPWNWVMNIALIGPMVMFPVLSNVDSFYHGIVLSFIELSIVYIIYSVLFYLFHVAFHSRYLYAWHKHHHSWTVLNHPWSAFDATWVEHACINVFPLAVACFATNASLLVCLVYIILGTENSMMAHVGKSEFHALHHKYTNVNYGIDPVCDHLFKTNFNKKV
jgi:sterol desaturase/sphingolipid hydroxylase (fatty acid hydroxylase superfamily)